MEETGPGAGGSPAVVHLIRELRPRQWTKNMLVFAAFFFAVGDPSQQAGLLAFVHTLLATVAFCAVSSGVYIFNDLRDLELDRAHPVKRFRPLAAGLVGEKTARASSVILMAGGLVLVWGFCPPGAGMAVSAYVLIQAAYTLWLKRIALVDVFVIALGFVLRALAGGLASSVRISPWLLLCAFLMALFLALCKRRHEIRMDNHSPENTRPSLRYGDEKLFDQLIAISASAAIICYAVYTQWPATVQKFDTHYLAFTVPFVVFGIFRYLDLVYRKSRGDQPEAILLTDIPLLVDMALYGAAVLLVVL